MTQRTRASHVLHLLRKLVGGQRRGLLLLQLAQQRFVRRAVALRLRHLRNGVPRQSQ
jgi:hypothetical protein